MKITSARVVPWSSVVGGSVTLHDDNGSEVCQLAILGAKTREASENIAHQIADAFDDLRRHSAVTANLGMLSTSKK